MGTRTVVKKVSETRRVGKPAAAPRGRRRGRPGLNADGVGPEALVAMAVKLLSQRAPGDITRADLARFAKVDPGLIRYYFSDRDSLLRSAADALTQQLQQRAAVSERADLTPPKRIAARMKALLVFKTEHPFYHRLMMEEIARSADAKSRELYQRIASTAIDRYRSYLQEGGASGELREVDAAFLYCAIIGLCDFFVSAAPILTAHFGGRNTTEVRADYAEFICDLLLNGLRPR